MIFIGDKAGVALFVEDILQTFGFDYVSITITFQSKSEDCSVRIVTDMLSAGIVLEMAMNYSLQLIDTSILPTQAG